MVSPAASAASSICTGRPSWSKWNADLRIARVASGMAPKTSAQQVSLTATSSHPHRAIRSDRDLVRRSRELDAVFRFPHLIFLAVFD
jgi:hypothetical protein